MNLFFWRHRRRAVALVIATKPPSPTENPATQHEPNDINIRAVAWVAGAFVATLALVFAGGWGLWKVAENHDTNQSSPLPPPMRVQSAPPSPRLQADVGEDEAVLRAQQQGELNSYGWVDKARGQTRIPINRAMDLVAAGGETNR